MIRAKPLEPLRWLAILFVAGVAVYAIGLSASYYDDDYQFVFDQSPGWTLGDCFFRNIPGNNLWRPLQASFLWLVQQGAGLNTVPVHATQLALHVLLSWLVFLFLLDLRFARTQAALASLLMLVSQANVHAVSSNDTISQVGSTLFGYLSLWLMFRSLDGRNAASRGRLTGASGYVLSLLSLAVSCLWKESGLAFLPMVIAVIGVLSVREGRARALSKVLRLSVPFVVVAVVYVLARSRIVEAQASLGSEKYDFHIGANLVRNAAMFILAAAMPVSTVSAYTAVKSGDALVLAGMIAATVVPFLPVARGLWSSRGRSGVILLLGAFFVIGLFPNVLLNHVSELYVYNSMPVVCALYGIGLGRCLDQARSKRPVYYAFAAFIALVLASHVFAVEGKVSLMKNCGERSDALLSQIEPFLKDVPEGGRLILLDPCNDEPEYSVFLQKGFGVIRSMPRLNQMAGRDDFAVEIVDRCKVDEASYGADALLLILDGGVKRLE